MVRSPRSLAMRASSTGRADVPETLKIIMTSVGRNAKFAMMASARPETRSMNIACRWPLEPTTCVWNVVDNSNIGLKPGNGPVGGELFLTRDAEVPAAEHMNEPAIGDCLGRPPGCLCDCRSLA